MDRLLAREDLQPIREQVGPALFAELVRAAIDAARRALLAGQRAVVPTDDEVSADVLERAARFASGRARPVINATGVLLHTNLGRAPLSERAAAAVRGAMQGYSSIELDLETGKRGRRAGFVDEALASVSGAEAALVVNNCAAAVLLLLSATASGRGVIVSRGELVEIGGGFRVPDVMAQSGARLIEVGTTNKTRLADYERALDEHPDAVAILRVHQGNFRQLGFVERPALADLGALAASRGVMLLKDLGGGALVDLAQAGFVGEPLVTDCVAAGCTAVTFSTDKVLGGPQGGALVGARDVIERARRHPLARALRAGRLPIVALEATLESYLLGRAWQEIPALAMAKASVGELAARVDGWVAELSARGLDAERVDSEAEMGGGTLAARAIPSVALALTPRSMSAGELGRSLRLGAPAILARVQDARVLLDARTIRPEEGPPLMLRLFEALAPEGSSLSRPAESS
ncbi:MAG: L-seryl-tRNA(Sec) selenium transferase [Polyangiaceae bacterium]|nr:L-seryl-tRNA(Sec) selenium transferase [Polyangiaceae bacterium]